MNGGYKMTDINEYKLKKLSRKISEIGESTRSGGYAIAEAIYAFAFRMKEMDSQLKANQRNIDKLK
jgi:hypothetical protein